MPVMAPDLKASSRPPASDLVAACATRTLARTDTFMPMKPVAPDSIAPTRKPTATSQPSVKPRMTKITTPTMRDGGVLTLEIGLRAFAHGRGNLLHLLAAGVGAQAPTGRPDAVNDREHATADDQP